MLYDKQKLMQFLVSFLISNDSLLRDSVIADLRQSHQEAGESGLRGIESKGFPP